ncbi:hypothetical protein EWM64_g10090 [Hericium alpestre]|uniref:TEA domain-containing protein n=1 Tax=Hericium alpestre TaxID=135208 RepID=A0A4Y9ZJ61_9AGAM|nr:hypothetical protein EWM64_g10090 [Hericium alpestre]
MLKDGTSEVWPESVEQIFVQGLREYWESPWATYSRGRSRWRNQFLVDYLRAAGIHRSKKQVASHIQVLRNMWKGEPEYQLVAGGEELLQDSGSLAPADMKQHSPESVSSDVPVKEEQSDPQMPLTLATPNTALELNQFYPRAHMPAHSPVERLPDPYLSPLPLQSNAHASVKAEAPPYLLPDVSHDAFAPAHHGRRPRRHVAKSGLAVADIDFFDQRGVACVVLFPRSACVCGADLTGGKIFVTSMCIGSGMGMAAVFVSEQ